MKKGTIILIAIVVILGIWIFSGYNSLVSMNEGVDAQWAQVETQYQRRLDLIPNLANSVKGILTQEQKVFGDIAEARTRYAGAANTDEKARAASDLETGLGRLLVVMENYPQLNSNKNIQDLMTQIEGTENRVSVERNRFNETVFGYNTAIKRFPKNILATITGFDERAYFKSANGAEVAPTVNLE